jgi:hypothetical protein
MALRKKPTITEKRAAASKATGRRSYGPIAKTEND